MTGCNKRNADQTSNEGILDAYEIPIIRPREWNAFVEDRPHLLYERIPDTKNMATRQHEDNYVWRQYSA